MKYPVVWYASSLHLVWAVVLLFSMSPTRVSGLNILYEVFPNRYLLSFILMASSVMAFFALHAVRNSRKVLWLLPQQFLLLMAAIAILQVVSNGAFADGVVRDRYFITADKIGIVLIAIFHTLSLAQNGSNKKVR